MKKPTRLNGLITVDDAMIKYDVSRDTIYRLIRPRRSGRTVHPPKVRSKRDHKRRWVHSKDLHDYLNAPPTEAELKPLARLDRRKLSSRQRAAR